MKLSQQIPWPESGFNQDLYRLPGYIAALQSALLNEAATLFRRKYDRNGSHAGFILYISDAAGRTMIDMIEEELKKSKGPGNFRNLLDYAPNGKEDGVQILPISEVAAKDDVMHMKNVTREDVPAAHRVPPQRLGIVPVDTAAFGSIREAAGVFFQRERKPVMSALLDLNDLAGEHIVSFGDDQPESVPPPMA